MSKVRELRQKLGQAFDAWKSALEARDSAKPEERESADTKVAEAKAKYERLKQDVSDAEAFEAEEKAMAGEHISDVNRRQGGSQGGGEEAELDKIRKKYRLLRHMDLAQRGKVIDGVEAEMAQEADKEARQSGISLSGTVRIPGLLKMGETRADLAVGTNTAGGYTVFTEPGGLIPILEPKLVTRALGAEILTGLTGNLTFPRNNADSAATWEGENTDNDQTDITFDTVALSPKRLGCFVVIGKQLMIQSSIDVENYVRRRMNFAIGRAVDVAAINGSGSSNQPTGVLNTSGIGSVAIGTNGGNPTWSHIVNLESAIATADADLGRLSYLTTPGVRGKLKQTEKASNTGMFVWTDERAGDSRMGQLNGLNAFTSTLVPSTLPKGTAIGVCHAVLIGNWEELMIGQWAGLDITLDNITLAGKAQIKLIVNSWWDIAVKHAASFAAIKDATIS